MNIEARNAKERPDDRRRAFTRFKDFLRDAGRKAAVVAAISVAIVCAQSCGGDTKDRDGGADAAMDGGRDGGSQDADHAGDSGVMSPCSIYGDGHENRLELGLGEAFRPECEDWGYLFSEITSDGRVILMGYNISSPGATDWKVFSVAEPQTLDVPAVGDTVVEICLTSGGACKYNMYSEPEGDPNCRITVAADRSLRCY